MASIRKSPTAKHLETA